MGSWDLGHAITAALIQQADEDYAHLYQETVYGIERFGRSAAAEVGRAWSALNLA